MSTHDAGDEGTPMTAPEPSLAERARTLVYSRHVGSLSTLSAQHLNYPFGSVTPYGLDNAGRPTFLISRLAMHTQNLLRDPRASLLVTELDAERDPLGTARVTLMGTVHPVSQKDDTQVRESYLARHEDARFWVDFGDFSFYRMEVTNTYFVGGFGLMGWISARDYAQVEIDPLADIAASILTHMNTDHHDALLLMAQQFGAGPAKTAQMTAVDRLGFHLQVTNAEATQGLRLPFPREVRTADEVRKVLVEMTQQARGHMLNP